MPSCHHWRAQHDQLSLKRARATSWDTPQDRFQISASASDWLIAPSSRHQFKNLSEEIIRAQSQKLKRELDHEIEKQLSVKIKAQEKAITNLKTGIESLRRENDQVWTVPGRPRTIYSIDRPDR